jgi:hypothetical protein
MSKIEVNAIEPQSGTTLTVGASGDTVTVPSGVTFDASNATTTLPSNVVTTTGTQTLTNKTIDASQLTDSTISLAKLSATGTKDATTFLRGDNSFAEAGGGKVLQVVQTVKTDTYTSTATSMTDITGMSVSITPSATGSKILILVDAKISNDTGNSQHVHLRRNASDEIYRGDASGNKTRASSSAYVHATIAATGYYGVIPISLTYLDSPNTTSATTYKLSHTSGEVLQFCLNQSFEDDDIASRVRTASSITAIEIGV